MKSAVDGRLDERDGIIDEAVAEEATPRDRREAADAGEARVPNRTHPPVNLRPRPHAYTIRRSRSDHPNVINGTDQRSMLKKQSLEDKAVNMAIHSVSRYPSSPAEATEPPKGSRISFSVASILADTKANQVDETAEMIRHHRTIPESPLRQSPSAQPELPGGKTLSPRQSSQTPPPNPNASATVTSSEDEYEDSVNQEDSIVDVEDLRNGTQSEDEERAPSNDKGRLVRPTPFSALAAAAAAYHSLGWPAPAPVVPSFGSLFQSHFPVGPMTGSYFLLLQ